MSKPLNLSAQPGDSADVLREKGHFARLMETSDAEIEQSAACYFKAPQVEDDYDAENDDADGDTSGCAD